MTRVYAAILLIRYCVFEALLSDVLGMQSREARKALVPSLDQLHLHCNRADHNPSANKSEGWRDWSDSEKAARYWLVPGCLLYEWGRRYITAQMRRL